MNWFHTAVEDEPAAALPLIVYVASMFTPVSSVSLAGLK